jgi:tetratricopeptide (TPR) repeat protein
MKRIAILFILIVLMMPALAQRLTVNSPSHVAEGEQFRLSYTINSQKVSGFTVGEIPEEFDVLMGPSQSSQHSVQMINGNVTQSASITYTYILFANKKGVYKIPPAYINADGKDVKSSETVITVTEPVEKPQVKHGQGQPQVDNSVRDIKGSDLFIRVTASKKNVYEQEPVLLTYKVYTLVNLTSLDGKMPDLKGFHTQEIPLPQQKSFKIETINGKAYKTVTWSQYVMFPQITGKMEIPSITFNGIVVQQNRYIDPFEAFFNGMSGYVETKKKIIAPAINLDVKPLPERPANFSGGVGEFNISAVIDNSEVKANDPVKLIVNVSGTGNMKLLKEPLVNFPKDFDVYDAKVSDNSKLTVKGVEGTITYEYLAVPRHQGKYEIPPVEFVYFDINDGEYKTLTTQPFELNVAKGAGVTGVSDYTNKEDLKLLNKDIRYIKTGDANIKSRTSFFFGSLNYWLSLLAVSILFGIMFIMLRMRMSNNSDTVMLRDRKARKIATKRLKIAAKMAQMGKPNELYDEILKALWGYVGDKLNMPVEQLSRDNIKEKLSANGVGDETINKFIFALDECEFARYAPGDVKGNMNKTYDAAAAAIIDIENTMKTRKNNRFAMLLFMLLVSMASVAQDKAVADSAYAKEDYQNAISIYESLLSDNVSPELYYNLGNAYYRLDDMPHAILNYERALLLSPGDSDIRFNLQMARNKTIDKIIPESEMFFVTWYKSLVNIMGVDGWAILAIIMFALAAILILLYVFTDVVIIRKIGFFGAGLSMIIFVVANVFAYQQGNKVASYNGAIIMSTANVKSTPAENGTDLFVLHEGTRVDITDDSMNDWKEVRIADGKEGWIETKKLELI